MLASEVRGSRRYAQLSVPHGCGEGRMPTASQEGDYVASMALLDRLVLLERAA